MNPPIPQPSQAPERGPSPTRTEAEPRPLDVSARTHAAVVEAALDCIVTVDASGTIREWNPAAETTFGIDRSRALGAQLADLVVPPRHRRSHLEGFESLVARGDGPILGRRIEVEAMRADGTEFPCELSITRISSDPLLFTAFARDLSLQHARERQLHELARENELILSSAGDGILRLDDTGRIAYANPAAGHLLERRPEDLVGRLATETVHHTREDGSHLEPVDTPMWQALERGEVRRVTTEVFWRGDGRSFPVDYTMAPLRRDGEISGAVCVFADITEERRRINSLRERLEWQGRISRAIEEDRLLAYAQPIVRLETEEHVLDELLVRMRETDGSRVLAAAEFVPEAERLGLIAAVDEWMVARALERVAAGSPSAVNLSTATATNASAMTSIVDRIVAAAPEPGSLVIEITETAAIDDMEKTRELIERLTAIGCPLAIDDFGTGYASIVYLRQLDSRFVKIDRSFVSGVADEPSDRRVVAGIVSLARLLGQVTIAEGIETTQELRACRALGVDLGQGYLFGRPEPIAPPRGP